MKMFLVAFAAATLIAGHAYAGEGAGDPFAFRTAPVASFHAVRTADVGSEAYPHADGRPTSFQNATLAPTGSEGVVQTASSLPRGFSNGSPAVMQAQAATRHFALVAARRTHAQG